MSYFGSLGDITRQVRTKSALSLNADIQGALGTSADRQRRTFRRLGVTAGAIIQERG